jgi:hypothetical protein
VSLQNAGDQPASTVHLSVTVPGEILAHLSIPEARDQPPWVSITPAFDASTNPNVVSYELNRLAVGPKLKVEVSYRRTAPGEPKCEIFADGFPAVPSGATVGKNETRTGITVPLTVFIVGMLVTLGVSTFYRLRNRPELKSSFGIVLRTLFPFKAFRALSRQIITDKEYEHYRNELLKALLKQTDVEFLSLTKGTLQTNDPEEFWDIRLKIDGVVVGIDAHTASQNWFDNASRELVEFCAYLSSMTIAMRGKSFLVFDRPFGSPDNVAEVRTTLDDFNRASAGHDVALVFGSPAEAAREIGLIASRKKT